MTTILQSRSKPKTATSPEELTKVGVGLVMGLETTQREMRSRTPNDVKLVVSNIFTNEMMQPDFVGHLRKAVGYEAPDQNRYVTKLVIRCYETGGPAHRALALAAEKQVLAEKQAHAG